MRHHLREACRDNLGFGRELFTQFAANAQATADQLRRWRDSGGSHRSVSKTKMGLGSDIKAHIDYIAEVKRLLAFFIPSNSEPETDRGVSNRLPQPR